MFGRMIVGALGLSALLTTWTGCGARSAEENSQSLAMESSAAGELPPHESPQLATDEAPNTHIAPANFVVDEGLEHSVLVASHVDSAEAKSSSKLESPSVTTSPIQQASFEAD
jgi:hypothetical protein